MRRSNLLVTSMLAATLTVAMAGVGRAQPVTGLYIGGGGGANFLQREKQERLDYTYTPIYFNAFSNSVASPILPPSRPFVSTATQGFKTGLVGLASAGYGFGNGLRLEFEGNYRNNQFIKNSTVLPVSGREEKYGAMGNVLFDLDVGSPYVFPYIGGGVGYQRVSQTKLVRNQFTNNGNGTVTSIQYSSSNTPFHIQNQQDAFAYQAIAGMSLPIPTVVGLSLTAEYRYFALTGKRFSIMGGKTKEDYNHDLILGVRYAFNTPVPVAAAAAVPPRPVGTADRTYLVFFDWDLADLTTRARSILNEAAQATRKVAVTRIEVSGHTDKSGTARYNAGLSQRRAANVAAELVRLGVPRSAITTQAFGETRPLVQTADGVREPQNRRVEIVLR